MSHWKHKGNFGEKNNNYFFLSSFFFRIFFHKCKVCIVWNYFNLAKIIVLRLFKMVANQTESSRLKTEVFHQIFGGWEVQTMWNLHNLSCVRRDIGIMVRVFVNGPEDRGSIPGRVIPKTKKWYLMPPCLTLSIMKYRSRVKWSNPGKGVEPCPTPWCSSYRKRSLWVTLDYGRQLYFRKKHVLVKRMFTKWSKHRFASTMLSRKDSPWSRNTYSQIKKKFQL